MLKPSTFAGWVGHGYCHMWSKFQSTRRTYHWNGRMHFQHLSNYLKSPPALPQSASCALRFRFQALSGRNLLIVASVEICTRKSITSWMMFHDVPIVQCADRGSDVTPVHHAIPGHSGPFRHFALRFLSAWDTGTAPTGRQISNSVWGDLVVQCLTMISCGKGRCCAVESLRRIPMDTI